MSLDPGGLRGIRPWLNVLGLAAFALATTQARADDWPQWLGPQRDGVWREDGILDKFPKDGPKVRWRTPIGSGYAGPAVAKGRVYVTDRVLMPDAKDPANQFARGKTPAVERVLCLNEADGKVLWKHEYDCTYTISYPAGPRTTPVVQDGKVFTLGAEGHLLCLETEAGKVVWSRDLKKDYEIAASPVWGFSSNPLLDGKKLFCLVGGKGTTVVAFDKDTGKELWRALDSTGGHGPGYGSPVLIEAGGQRQLIVWHPEAVSSLDPETGKVHWEQPFRVRQGISLATPRRHGDLLFGSAFYDGSLMLRLDRDKPAAGVVWKRKGQSERKTDALHCLINTPFIEDGHIYGVCSYGQLRCLKADTGDRLWETLQATGAKGNDNDRWATAFIVKNGNRFFLFNEKGELIIAKLGPDEQKGYEEISRARILEPTNTARGREVVWSHPAFANQCVYARNDKEIVCVSLAAEPAKRPGVGGDWVGTWGPYSPPKDGAAQPPSKYTKEQLRLDCKVVELRDGKWQATFEGECGRPYKYTIQMTGRQVGDAVLFQGTADLGEKDGGIYDWIGRATNEEFIGFYTSKKYTGQFRLARPKETKPAAPGPDKKPAPQPASPENCQAAADYSAKHGGLAVLVMIDGKMVFERYDNGHAADKLTHLHSATKGFWGPVVAAMIEDKLIESFDELACETLTEWKDDPRKRTITVRHLLQLNAGLAQDVVNLQGHDRPTLAPDLYKHAVGLKAASDPGERFVYGPSCYYALGELMKRKLAAKKQTPLDYLKARILDPIGVKVGKWVQDKSGNPHIPNGAYLTAGDWARYGQFLLQGGQWDGKQIVKRELLDEFYTPSKANPGHGLAIWLNRPGGRGATPLQKANAEAGFIYPAGVPDLFAALGAGKCRMYVIPSLKMVALRQCDSARDAYQDDVFLGLLLEGKNRAESSPRIGEKDESEPDKKSIEKKEGKEESIPRPTGIFSVGLRRQPPPKELLEKPFVDGVTIAEGWVYAEPAEGKYDFSTIEKALAAVEPFNKKLTICLFPFPVPDWLSKDPKVQTYKVPHAGPGFTTPVPWDERGLTRWEALCKALSEHQVKDASQGGKLVPLKDHPLLSAVHCWPMGMNGIRDIAMMTGKDTPLHQVPNYSRERLTSAILRSTHAMVDRFPKQFHCLPFFRIQGNTASPSLEQHLIGALKKEFWSGKGAPRAGLLQENLSAGGPNASGGSVLIQEKSDTYIMLQAIESWAKPTQGFAGAVRQGAPEDAIRRGYDLFDCRYFEIYMADLLHKDFEDGFQKWHTFLHRGGPMPAPAKTPLEGKPPAEGNTGRLKSVDVEKSTITMTVGDKDQVFSVAGAKLLRPDGGDIPGGLQAVKTFLDRQAVAVTLKTEKKEGKEVVTEVQFQPAGRPEGKPVKPEGKPDDKPAKPDDKLLVRSQGHRD